MSLLPSVFVSYARTDSHSIQYAVGLLEAGGAEVFRDIDDIGFGERWEDVITDRINGCERVLVFWSKAAQESEWVGREYKMALMLGKKLVPVMLDNTPLPQDLGAFHALTLSHFTPKTSRLKRYGGWILGGVATTALVGVLGSDYLSNNGADSLKMDSVAPSAISESSSATAAPEQGNTVTFNQQTQRAPAAAVAVPEASRIPAPKPMFEPSTITGNKTDNNDESGEGADNSAATTISSSAPVTEDMQLTQLLPWIVGILALLALGWLAVRRFTTRDNQVAGERFVEMVFDEQTATESEKTT